MRLSIAEYNLSVLRVEGSFLHPDLGPFPCLSFRVPNRTALKIWESYRIKEADLPEYTPQLALKVLQAISRKHRPINLKNPDLKSFRKQHAEVLALLPCVTYITPRVIRILASNEASNVSAIAGLTDEKITAIGQSTVILAHTYALRALARAKIAQDKSTN